MNVSYNDCVTLDGAEMCPSLDSDLDPEGRISRLMESSLPLSYVCPTLRALPPPPLPPLPLPLRAMLASATASALSMGIL